MYVKVHKKENQWFRDDNGALIGNNIHTKSKDFDHLKILLGDDRLFVKTDEKVLSVYHGYFREDKFFRFCSSKNCGSCAVKIKTLFCPRAYDKYKTDSAGYYIIT